MLNNKADKPQVMTRSHLKQLSWMAFPQGYGSATLGSVIVEGRME